ncbi:unnamed protein product [Rhizoctonia solani]|uniref:HMG box domain-containing protein n=1 Tax=Rhizoctonia solani TaxID=456999 RepID=A0A8H3E6K8_9AGAM|nr:unnamed protein product [Rhizoctonia solani]
MHTDGCECDCTEDAEKLAKEHDSSTLLWAFMLRLSNEKDPSAALTLRTVSSSSESNISIPQHATEHISPTEQSTGNDSRDDTILKENLPRKTARDTAPKPRKTATRATRKTKPKDPNEPKRPVPAYIWYQNSVRDTVKSRFPGYSPIEIIQEIARMWKALSEDERQVYKGYTNMQTELWMKEVKAYRQRRDRLLGAQNDEEPSPKRRRESLSLYESVSENEIIEID